MAFSIYLLQIVAFMDLLAVGLIVPLVPRHVREMGGNQIHVGLLGSIYAGFQLGSGPLIGSLSDLKGRKVVLILTLLISSIAYACLGLTNSIVCILIIRAILGLFKQTQVLTKALVPDYESNHQFQGDIYGKMAAISGAGITLGPAIGGHIAEDHPENGFTYIALIVCLCFAFNAGLVYFLPKPSVRLHKRKSNDIKEHKNLIYQVLTSIRQSLVELYKIKWSKYWDIFLLKALVGFAMGVYYTNYELYLRTTYNLSSKYVGYVISFQGIIGSVSSFFIGYINSFYSHDKDYSLRNFHVFLLLSISLLGMLLSFNVIMYTIWLIPLAIGNAVARLITLEMILKRSHNDHRGKLIGASNSIRSMAGVIAPIVSGFIGQYFGLTYVLCASLFSTTVGVALSHHYRSKRIKTD